MPLTQGDFEYVRTLVRERSAIVLEADKQYLVETRLQGLARREGFDSLDVLLKQLRATSFNGLHQKVVEVMTTNETSFFRDVQPFEMLRKVVVPELVKRRSSERQLQIWCAASSTGQEPYSVALLLREHFPALASWNVRIIASDISTEVLEKARRGRYSQLEVNRGLPAPLLVKYFTRQGVEWELRSDIRQMVDYRLINLIEPWPRLPLMDIILIRNVLIYFDVETKKQILAKVRRQLRPDGYLFLGGAETTMNLDDSFERVEYQRAGCYQLRK